MLSWEQFCCGKLWDDTEISASCRFLPIVSLIMKYVNTGLSEIIKSGSKREGGQKHSVSSKGKKVGVGDKYTVLAYVQFVAFKNLTLKLHAHLQKIATLNPHPWIRYKDLGFIHYYSCS